MIYIFDNSSLSRLKHFYPEVFVSIWTGLDDLVQQNKLVSTKEVWNEAQRGQVIPFVYEWLKDRKHIFTTPEAAELRFVSEIFRVKHFHSIIGNKQRLNGTPVADPFVIACAKIRGGTVVTEEELKPNSARIPTVCQHFGIECISLEGFMKQQDWSF